MPAEWTLSLFELYRSVSRYSDYETKFRANETRRLIHAYIGATHGPVWRNSPGDPELRRYPAVAAVLRRLERAISADDASAFDRAWAEMSPRGRRLFDVAFRWEFRKRHWRPDAGFLESVFAVDGTLLDRNYPYRAPLLISRSLAAKNKRGEKLRVAEAPIPLEILTAAIKRAIRWNARRRRPPVSEQDEAAADVLAAYFFLTGEHPRELSHFAGSSKRIGKIFDFVSAVEKIYRVPLLRAHSGAGLTRVLARSRLLMSQWAGG